MVHENQQTGDLDATDRRILRALQEDGRLTNQELADRVGLSASQCSRRRTRLEESRTIEGYTARLDRQALGFGLTSIISVRLATHNRDNAKRLADLFRRLPEVMEAHALAGSADYMVKVVTRDLKELSLLINETLLPHEAVEQVQTSVVLETLKEGTSLPL